MSSTAKPASPASIPPASSALPAADSAPAAPPRSWLFWAVLAAVVLAAFCSGFTRIWNFDMFWHLACGEWMFQYGQVLRTDPFSINPEPAWMDVHWGFQLLVTACHRLGGFELLTWLKALLTLATPAVLVLGLRRRVHPGWLAFTACVMLMAMLDRIRLRPELVTMLLSLLVLWLVDSVRCGERPRRLWWLVPLMVLWVNMHGLYFFGLVIIWSGIVGVGLDRLLRRDPALNAPLLTRRALLPLIAATLACLVSPWPIEAAAHPLTLFSRVSGQAIYFTYGVAELQPTLQALGKHVEVIVLAALAALAMLANRRRVPAGHVLVLAFFVAIGLMARRNVSLLAPAGGYLLALHGQAVLSALGRARPRLPRLAGPLSVAMLLLTVVLASLFAAEAIHRWRNSTMRFGAGLLRQNYPVEMAKFLARLPAEGDILSENFGDAGVFEYYSYPRRKLFMDGRLEAHPIGRFVEFNRIGRDLRTPVSAGLVELPAAVRFIVVPHNDRQPLSALMQSGRFQLLHIDPPAICFARTDWPGGKADELPAANFQDFDHPLDAASLAVEGFPMQRRHWYRQNAQPLNYWLGSMMLYLGQPVPTSAALGPQEYGPYQQRALLLSIRYLNAAVVEDLVDRPISASLLAEAHQHWASRFPLPADLAPVDVNLARALFLFGTLDLSNLDDDTMRSAALEQVLTLVQAQQFDRAYQAATDLLDHLPPGLKVNPPLEFLRVRDTIALKLRQARSMLADVEGTPLQRAKLLATRQFGLSDQAAGLLEQAPQKSPAEWLFLGDLFLRQGQVDKAREAYRQGGGGELRPILCDWVEGNFEQAARRFAEWHAASQPAGEAAAAADDPRSRQAIARLYHALFLEQLGRYGQAREVLGRASSQNEALQDLIDKTRNRLLQWE